MSRLNKERQAALEPNRMQYAIAEISALGYDVHHEDERKIKFMFKGSEITFYPYSGWASGKTINDGRGIKELLNQLK